MATAEAKQQELTKKSLPGRIFAAVKLVTRESTAVSEDQVTGVVAINPNTGSWELIAATSQRQRVSSARVLPYGKILVYSVTSVPLVGLDGKITNTGPEEIWVCDIEGHNKLKVVTGKGAGPVWSPDGKYIISSKRRGRDEYNTWRLNADGSNLTKIPLSVSGRVCDWSADGKWLLTILDQIYVVGQDGTRGQRVTNSKDALIKKPSFAPDSRRIVYVQYPGGDRPLSLRVVDIDGKNNQEVLREENLAAPQEACWSPNGRHLAVVMFDFEMMSSGHKGERAGGGNRRIIIMDANGLNRRLIRLHNVSTVTNLGSLDWCNRTNMVGRDDCEPHHRIGLDRFNHDVSDADVKAKKPSLRCDSNRSDHLYTCESVVDGGWIVSLLYPRPQGNQD
jgi:Tol biopolymer transport system component